MRLKVVKTVVFLQVFVTNCKTSDRSPDFIFHRILLKLGLFSISKHSPSIQRKKIFTIFWSFFDFFGRGGSVPPNLPVFRGALPPGPPAGGQIDQSSNIDTMLSVVRQLMQHGRFMVKKIKKTKKNKKSTKNILFFARSMENALKRKTNQV